MPKIKEKLKHYNWNEKASYYLNLAKNGNSKQQPAYTELEEAPIETSFGNHASESGDMNGASLSSSNFSFGLSSSVNGSSSGVTAPLLKMECRMKVLETHINELNEKLIERDEKILMQESQIECLKREIEELRAKSPERDKNLDMCSREKLLSIAACIFQNFGSDESDGIGNGLFNETTEHSTENEANDDGCRYVSQLIL